jgi:hypothetical protein
MRPVKIVMRVTAAALLFVAGPAAQAPPDFSGRWTIAPDPPAPPTQRGGRTVSGSLGSGWGPEITVTQNAATITIEYAQFARGDMQPPTKFVYRLDGTESRNTINMGRGPQEQVSKTGWDGSRLMITTSHQFHGPGGKVMTSETRQVLSLESPAVLLVETTRSAVMGGQPSTTTTTYKKN